MAVIFLIFGLPATAFTNADADASVNAYLKAFVRPNESSDFIKGDRRQAV